MGSCFRVTGQAPAPAASTRCPRGSQMGRQFQRGCTIRRRVPHKALHVNSGGALARQVGLGLPVPLRPRRKEEFHLGPLPQQREVHSDVVPTMGIIDDEHAGTEWKLCDRVGAEAQPSSARRYERTLRASRGSCAPAMELPTRATGRTNCRGKLRGARKRGHIIVGKYKVTAVLGKGGIGLVTARHLELDGDVALKFLLPQVRERPGISARFAQEAPSPSERPPHLSSASAASSRPRPGPPAPRAPPPPAPRGASPPAAS